MIPHGGVCGCVRLKGAMGYGNTPAPDTLPSLNHPEQSTSVWRKTPGLRSTSISNQWTHFFSLDAWGASAHQDFTSENRPIRPNVCGHPNIALWLLSISFQCSSITASILLWRLSTRLRQQAPRLHKKSVWMTQQCVRHLAWNKNVFLAFGVSFLQHVVCYDCSINASTKICHAESWRKRWMSPANTRVLTRRLAFCFESYVYVYILLHPTMTFLQNLSGDVAST